MKRIPLQPRPDLRAKAEAAGFTFHEMHGLPYWDETSAYGFTLAQVENDIEDPATALHAMCRAAVAEVVGDEAMLARLGIPAEHMDLVAASWAAAEPELYGRFDLAYDGAGPAKLLEYNADTPTSLYEAAVFQWQWLEDMLAAGHLPAGADQFNSIHESLVARFPAIAPVGSDMHFASVADNAEDYGTVETLAWAAGEAGITPHYTTIEGIGLTAEEQFADSRSRVIGRLFKLYPWEDLLREDFARHITPSGCRFVEPAWKAILSNKGILPVLWRLFEGHPNLLPAVFADDDPADPVVARALAALEAGGWVEKPLFSREGAGISIHHQGQVTRSVKDGYAEWPRIRQLLHPLPDLDGNRPVVGAWIVGEACCGIGLREDDDAITQDLSRFKPHFIWP